MESQTSYRAEIDGLRAIAVLAILLDHAQVYWLPGGFAGVDIFFVISGFVITRILARDLAAGRFSLTGFWRRRMRRILPALFALLLVCLPIAWLILLPDELEAFLKVFLGAAVMVPNMVLAAEVDYFAPDAESQPLLHLWSLGVEEQFYLFFPLLLLALWRTGPRARWWLLAGLTAIGLGVGEVMNRYDDIIAFYYLPSRSWELLAGALAALTPTRFGRVLREGLAGLGLILLTLSLLIELNPGPGLSMLPVVIGTALCLTQAGSDSWTGRLLSLRPVVLIGKVSFGAYLWHWPLLSFVPTHLADDIPLWARLVLVALALVLGWLSWRFIETPFRRTDAPVFPRLGIRAGLAAAFCMATIGGAAILPEARGWRDSNWPGIELAVAEGLLGEGKPFDWARDCHLSTRASPIEPFLAGWDCPAHTVGQVSAWHVALYGDSHGEDFATILRLAGLNPMQISGWGCSPVPSLMRPECRRMADMLRAAAKRDGIQSLVISNRWQGKELTPEALVELEVFWAEDFDRIAIVGPLPSFPRLKPRLLRWQRDRLAALEPEYKNYESFLKARKRVAGSEMIFIDATKLFCADRPGCSVFGKGPLMQDESGHLTLEAMQDYAKRLVASGVLDGIEP